MAEQRLLEVRGVISFTFDLPEKRCTVRVRSTLKPEVRRVGLTVRAGGEGSVSVAVGATETQVDGVMHEEEETVDVGHV